MSSFYSLTLLFLLPALTISPLEHNIGKSATHPDQQKTATTNEVGPELLVGIIKQQQRANVRKSYGKLAGQCFTDADLERFVHLQRPLKIANALRRRPQFRKLVLAIKNLPQRGRDELFDRCSTISRPTWAELGRVSSAGQTEAGQSAEILIAQAIVNVMRELVNQ